MKKQIIKLVAAELFCILATALMGAIGFYSFQIAIFSDKYFWLVKGLLFLVGAITGWATFAYVKLAVNTVRHFIREKNAELVYNI